MSHPITPALVLTIWPPFFDQVRSGEKTVEGRPFTSRYENLKVGDFVQIVDKGCCNNFAVEITRLTKYNSFSEMLENEGVANCLPGVETLEKGVETYHSFPSYADRVEQYGVIALGIKVCQASSGVALNQPTSAAQSFTNRTVTPDPNSRSSDAPGSNLEKEESGDTSSVKKVARKQFEVGDCAAKRQKNETL